MDEKRFRTYLTDGGYRCDKDKIQQLKRAAVADFAAKLAKYPDLAKKENQSPMILDSITQSNSAFRLDLEKRDRDKLIQEIYDEVFGLGPLTKLVNDSELSEIMCNGPFDVKVEVKGILYDTDIKFDDPAHMRQIINRIVSSKGRHVDDASPMADTRLDDGSRVNVVLDPVALHGPYLTIRKFSVNPFTTKDFISFGTMDERMADFLSAAVKSRLNICVSGGTGSGKTALLNVLSEFIPHSERIITIEDAAELRLVQPHVLPMEARPANIEGSGEINIRALVKNALRMRPDRIIVGEVRSGESMDMLQAMNTGHDGSLTTIHANSPRDALNRVETTALMSGIELPSSALKQQIASAFDLIVHTARLRDGSRKITSITEIVGMMGETISTQEIYKFVYDKPGQIIRTGDKITGHFAATGVKPHCCEKMENNGAQIKQEWFYAGY